MKKFICLIAVFAIAFSSFSFCVSAEKPAPAVSTMTSNGNGGKTDIGTWYVTYNNEQMWRSNFGSGFPILHRPLIGYDKNGEPIYGIEDSSNPDIIDFHLEQLAAAKVDFIIFDVTNGGLTSKVYKGWSDNEPNFIVENVKLACERISNWNDNNDWKIRYAIAVGCYAEILVNSKIVNGVEQKEVMSIGQCTEYQAEAVYKDFYRHPVYGDDHYMLDGKPLLIIHDWGRDLLAVDYGWNNYKGDRTYGDKFTVRRGQQGQQGCYGWMIPNDPIRDEEVMTIMPGWSSALSKYTNGHIRDKGKRYLSQWSTVLSGILPRIVVFCAFNDYNEDLAVFTTDTSKCNPNNDEKWIDETGKENPSMYWDMTIDGINRVRSINGEYDYTPVVKDYYADVFGTKPLSVGEENTANKSDKADNNGLLIGIIIGGAVILLVAATLLFVITKKKKAPKKEKGKEAYSVDGDDDIDDFDDDFDDDDEDD